MKILDVHWRDPHSVDPWTSLKELDTSPATIRSVGQLVQDTKDTIVLALNVQTDSDNVSCVMIIPKDAIIKKRVIK